MEELVIASDIHIAKAWDERSQKDNPANPNQELRNFLKKIPKNQTIIINGDVIEYYYTSKEEKETNWQLFQSIIKKHNHDYILNLGNHEYWTHPYSLSFWDTNHKRNSKTSIENLKNISKKFESKFPNISKQLYDPENHYPFPQHHYLSKNKTELIFLDTGPDAYVQKETITNPKIWRNLLPRFLPTRGVDNQGLRLLKERLKKSNCQNILLFLHCPPFFTKSKSSKIKLNKKSYNKSMKKFHKKGFGYCTFLKNNWNIIQELNKTRKNVIVFTGHTHQSAQFMMKDEYITSVDIQTINNNLENEKYVKFVSTLPLGLTRGKKKQLGYLKLKDQLEHVKTKEL